VESRAGGLRAVFHVREEKTALSHETKERQTHRRSRVGTGDTIRRRPGGVKREKRKRYRRGATKGRHSQVEGQNRCWVGRRDDASTETLKKPRGGETRS